MRKKEVMDFESHGQRKKAQIKPGHAASPLGIRKNLRRRKKEQEPVQDEAGSDLESQGMTRSEQDGRIREAAAKQQKTAQRPPKRADPILEVQKKIYSNHLQDK